MYPKNVSAYKQALGWMSNIFFMGMGLAFTSASVGILLLSVYSLYQCVGTDCDLMMEILDLVSRLIIAAAIFDVGRYLLEEEVFRDRELRSPSEARKSLTKFMVIIVLAVTLESLLAVLKASTSNIANLIYPAVLFFVAVCLLVGLGVYQRLSVKAENEVQHPPND